MNGFASSLGPTTPHGPISTGIAMSSNRASTVAPTPTTAPDRLRERQRLQDRHEEIRVLHREHGGLRRRGSHMEAARGGPARGRTLKKYPLVYIQYHDRLNVHTQHILNPALTLVQDEPLLQMNPIDASARGIKHDDIVKVYNDRGDMTLRVFVTEGIVPGTVATQSGWTLITSSTAATRTSRITPSATPRKHIARRTPPSTTCSWKSPRHNGPYYSKGVFTWQILSATAWSTTRSTASVARHAP